MDQQKVLGVVPARGGSKGVSRKNVREVAGKPLIAWTIEQAAEAVHLDRSIVSTEDDEIANVAREYGGEVPFTRPRRLAKDDVPSTKPIVHALDQLEESFDWVVKLHPTTPLRTADDIDQFLEFFEEHDAPACVSVTEPETSPYWMFEMGTGNVLEPLFEDEFEIQRQDLDQIYAVNGAMYAADVGWLRENRTFYSDATVGFEMDREHSLDIDDCFDLKVCDLILRHRRNTD
ncbi:MAG: cytidylyltransferase domain-containing protein [bacterium]